MKSFHRIVFFVVFLCITMFGNAQSSHFERIEMPDSDVEYYSCIPFDDCVLLKLTDDTKQTGRKNTVFTFQKYDTVFQYKSLADVTLQTKRSAFLEYTTKDAHYSLSYQISGTYTISVVSVKDLSVQYLHGKLPKSTSVVSLRAIGGYVYLLGYTKDLPFLLIQNEKTQVTQLGKIIPLNKNRFSIMSFEVNDETGEAYLFTKDVLKNDNLIKFYIYKDGVKTFETIVKTNDEDKYIVSASASRLSDGTCIISGTYGNISKNTHSSVGIFILKLGSNGEKISMRYINYLDIENFTSYLSARKQERIEKKQDKMQAQNKELELAFMMYPHKIIEQNGEYVLVGEAYYPTYRQECQYITTTNGQTMHCYQVFDGFQYTHFFLLGFNEQGDLLWSNSEPLYINEKPFSVTHFLSVNQKNSNVQLVYSSWNKIFIYDFNNGEKIRTDEISYVTDEERLLTSVSKNIHWYGNTFLSYGKQMIKNKDDKMKRKVFFIEKIEIPTK